MREVRGVRRRRGAGTDGRGRPLAFLATALLVAALTSCSMVAVAAARGHRRSRSSSGAGLVTITRDRSGIPHIVARNFTALGFGEGYAFAQDNLCTFANDVVTLRAERSRYFGPNALALNYSAGAYTTNLDSDFYWRYVRASGLIHRELTGHGLNALLPQVRQVYAGFVAGYNRYLRSGHLRDRACKGKPWVRPITMTDLLLRGVQVTTEGSSQQFVSDYALAAPPPAPARGARARGAHSTRSAATPAPAPTHGFGALKAQFGDGVDRAQGSNGIGIGALDTRSHHGMVLANPHFPWRGTERFWMAQLDVPGRYDVEGGTIEGFPLIGIGFNRHLAWTHTVSTSRRFVIYQLKLVPGDPTSYYLDGKPVPMGRVTVTVRYRGHSASHTFYTTHWGLVLDLTAVPNNGYGWSASNAYAVYDAVAGIGARTADQYLRMGQAKTVEQLFDVESRYLGIPTFNTIAADDRGDAYYGDVGATPAVSQSEISSCTPPGLPQAVFAQARVVTLDGSRSSCAPANFAGAPQRGIFDSAHLPHLFRRDYVENSNDSYWLANPSHPLTGFSPIVGLTAVAQGLRTRIGNLMIQARVAGTDHLGAPRFTLSTLQRMWEGDRSELAALVLHDLVADCRAHPQQVASNGQAVNLTTACNALAAWDGTGQLKARGGWL